MSLSWTKERGTWEYTPPTPEEEVYWRELHRFYANCNEASALANARRKVEAEIREKWESMVADKDAIIAELRAQLDKK